MALLASLAFFFLATSFADAATPTAKTVTQCYTIRTSVSVRSVATSSLAYTYTLPLYQTTTVTPTLTVTPSPTSTTTTSLTTTTTTTTLAPVTDTKLQTNTEIDTTTITAVASTTTLVSTATTTLTTSGTTTIATSSGFLPVASTLPNSKKRSVGAVSGRDMSPRRGGGTIFARASTQYLSAPKKGQALPLSYPKSVTCRKLVIVYSIKSVTKSASKTVTTTLRPSTSTLTTTNTVTATATFTPGDAMTTITTTNTVVVLATFIPAVVTLSSATTVTQTLVIPTATYYAACGPSNIVSSIDGAGITLAGGFDDYASTSGTTAYDCCVSCISNPNCGGTAFSGGTCVIGIQSSCVFEGQYSYYANGESGYGPNDGFTISNGNCAFYDSQLN